MGPRRVARRVPNPRDALVIGIDRELGGGPWVLEPQRDSGTIKEGVLELDVQRRANGRQPPPLTWRTRRPYGPWIPPLSILRVREALPVGLANPEALRRRARRAGRHLQARQRARRDECRAASDCPAPTHRFPVLPDGEELTLHLRDDGRQCSPSVGRRCSRTVRLITPLAGLLLHVQVTYAPAARESVKNP